MAVFPVLVRKTAAKTPKKTTHFCPPNPPKNRRKKEFKEKSRPSAIGAGCRYIENVPMPFNKLYAKTVAKNGKILQCEKMNCYNQINIE